MHLYRIDSFPIKYTFVSNMHLVKNWFHPDKREIAQIFGLQAQTCECVYCFQCSNNIIANVEHCLKEDEEWLDQVEIWLHFCLFR